MRYAKVAVTIEEDLLKVVDRSVKEHKFASRSQAVQQAVKEKFDRLNKIRLATECAKLDKKAEQALADEGLATDAQHWPEY